MNIKEYKSKDLSLVTILSHQPQKNTKDYVNQQNKPFEKLCISCIF